MSFGKITLLPLRSLTVADRTVTAQLRLQIREKVIAVNDGDTIEIFFNGKSLSIRFVHIDCPELKRSQPFGKAAKQFTSGMCFGQVVTVENDSKFDRHRRLIGIIINEQWQNVIEDY